MINIDNILNAEILLDPWAHKIVDNIFTDDAFTIINSAGSALAHLSVPDKTIPIHINEAIDLGISQEAAEIILDSADMLLANLKEIMGNYCSNGIFGGGYFIMPKFGITGRNFQYPIHDESIYKILNLVTYIQPVESIGTRLYTGPDENTLIKQVYWKPNRAALFYPGHGITWHNWQGQQSNEPRITLNFFVERMEALEQALHRPGEDLDLLLWFYEKMGQGRLHVEI